VNLTSKQRARLRSLAHGLSPVAHIGQSGVTDAAVQSVVDAFNTRELLKVKVQDGAPDSPRDTADQLVERIEGAHVAQTIGRIAVLYRPFPENPVLDLAK
jgi:RNA-binding protein